MTFSVKMAFSRTCLFRLLAGYGIFWSAESRTKLKSDVSLDFRDEHCKVGDNGDAIVVFSKATERKYTDPRREPNNTIER